METGLIIFGALAVFTLLALTVVLIVQQSIQIGKLVQQENTNTNRLMGMEKLMVVMYTILTQDVLDAASTGSAYPGPPARHGQDQSTYFSEDGHHSAGSFEELMGKMTNDPRYRVAEEEDIDEIKRRFQQYNEQDEDFGPGEFDPPTVEGDEWKQNGS